MVGQYDYLSRHISTISSTKKFFTRWRQTGRELSSSPWLPSLLNERQLIKSNGLPPAHGQAEEPCLHIKFVLRFTNELIIQIIADCIPPDFNPLAINGLLGGGSG
jgi:hypothetical protein